MPIFVKQYLARSTIFMCPPNLPKISKKILVAIFTCFDPKRTQKKGFTEIRGGEDNSCYARDGIVDIMIFVYIIHLAFDYFLGVIEDI